MFSDDTLSKREKEREDALARHPLFSSLDYQDSNLDKQNQNLLCYHYTIVQTLCAFLEKRCKGRAFLYILQIFSRLFSIFCLICLSLSKIYN